MYYSIMFIPTNPPFNVGDQGREFLRGVEHWWYGVPPVGNANVA